MYQQIRALLGLDHRVERQRGHPSHELLVCLKFHVVELLARRPATVDIPGLGIERILANDGIEHDLLVMSTRALGSERTSLITPTGSGPRSIMSPSTYSVSSDVNEILDRASSSARTCP